MWDITIETFKGLVATGAVPAEVFEKQTLPKLQGFKAAYGTVCVLFLSFLLVSPPLGIEPIALVNHLILTIP